MHSARDLICEMDQIARGQGLTQAEWCRRAGYDEFGKLISRTYKSGNCKLSVFCQLADAVGYDVVLLKKPVAEPEKKPETVKVQLIDKHSIIPDSELTEGLSRSGKPRIYSKGQ